jgi:2-amino-4-hydroxy-6-hydroxymethyldihydropteridine diphosphokinase
MIDVFVAVGGNVEPLEYLDRALQLLERQFGDIEVSPAYRNAAVGFSGEDFVNLVVKLRTDQSVEAVRAALQAIESACDRPPDAPKWAPRTMDLDILLYGNAVRSEPGLILPRPDLLKRPYMLKPTADLAPTLVHPTAHKPMRELWDALERSAPHAMQVVTIPRSGLRPPQ